MFIVGDDGKAEHRDDPDDAAERMWVADRLMQQGIDPTRAEDIIDGVEVLSDAGYPLDRAAAMMVAAARQQSGSVIPMAHKIIRMGQTVRDVHTTGDTR